MQNEINMLKYYLLELLKTILIYPWSHWKSRQIKKDLQQAKFFMFIGYPRSGHSLVGAILDAHPNIICANKLGVLKYILFNFSKKQIGYLAWKNSQNFVRQNGQSGHYNYFVPSAWQGRYESLMMFGDKQGDGAILRLEARPHLLKRLQSVMGQDTKFIHILRNPFDNISTISMRGNISIEESIAFYFKLVARTEWVYTQIPRKNIWQQHHEDFLENPHDCLAKLCHFLEVTPNQEYLDACCQIIRRKANLSRFSIDWSPQLIQQVEQEIKKYSFLSHYHYSQEFLNLR